LLKQWWLHYALCVEIFDNVPLRFVAEIPEKRYIKMRSRYGTNS
jgi:hypothetical protein